MTSAGNLFAILKLLHKQEIRNSHTR